MLPFFVLLKINKFVLFCFSYRPVRHELYGQNMCQRQHIVLMYIFQDIGGAINHANTCSAHRNQVKFCLQHRFWAMPYHAAPIRRLCLFIVHRKPLVTQFFCL